MTTPGSELESHPQTSGAAAPEGTKVEQVAGRSPIQLAGARFRKDKLSMTALVIVAVYLVLALFAPLGAKFGILDPYSFNSSAKFLDIEAGGIPKGFLGGVSWSHPLGIEPSTGRDRARQGVGGDQAHCGSAARHSSTTPPTFVW